MTAAETKASELVSAERVKMERAIVEARRQARDEAMAAINHQEESSEVGLVYLEFLITSCMSRATFIITKNGINMLTLVYSHVGTAVAKPVRRAVVATQLGTAAPSASTKTGRSITGCVDLGWCRPPCTRHPTPTRRRRRRQAPRVLAQLAQCQLAPQPLPVP